MGQENLDYVALARPLTLLFDQLGPEAQRLLVQTIRLLAKGRPVSFKTIAKTLDIRHGDVHRILARLGSAVELNRDGEVVAAMGLSLNPTVHRLKVGNRELFSWCASDAISLAGIIQKPVRVESPDPVTGAKIRLEVTPEGVRKVESPDAVVSWVTEVDPQAIRASFCNSVNFFASPGTAGKWLAKRPGMQMLTVREVERVDRHLVGPFRDILEL